MNIQTAIALQRQIDKLAVQMESKFREEVMSSIEGMCVIGLRGFLQMAVQNKWEEYVRTN